MTDKKQDAPLALIGIGCRFPGGVRDPDSLWQILIDGRCVVTDVPDDRWNNNRFYHPASASNGRMITRHGGFVDQLKQFDPAFWGISPREAMRLDPQQRWLLETAWESIEDAGIPPTQLRGTNVGVFVGAASHDYGTLQTDDLSNIDVHTNTGGTLSIAANRISYQLDLRGPSVAVDTACSSALVAVSMACRSIWSGDCEAALAGGVNALILPNSSIGFSKAGMLSPDGQCFAFDQRANGYVRGEGAGFVLLKPLDRAIEDQDPIYAVVRAAVVNQDGNTSSMTVPSVNGQSEMLHAAYRQADIQPRQVVYVEAHGTGTPVGDPIEAKALGQVLMTGRPDGDSCLIGSIKTNIGHLESASGIAGLIKTALVLNHKTVPPNTNFKTPNSEIPFEDLKLKVVDSVQPLPLTDNVKPVAAVNSFGFGGTNAHVVLEAAPNATTREIAETGYDRPVDRPFVLPISARDDASLRAYAQAYRRALKDLSAADLADFCYSAGARHEHHDQRMVVSGKDAKQLARRLGTWLQSGEADGTLAGTSVTATPIAGKPGPEIDSNAFVYTGQGSQWFPMGRQLIEREPIVRETVCEIEEYFGRFSGWSLMDALTRNEDPAKIHQTKVCQPAIFALQVALTRLWQSWGVEPNVVIGHSVGEIAAAWCAGVYSIEDATRLVYHRSRLQDTTGGRGRMLVVGMTPDEARKAIGELFQSIQVTAINSPSLVTLGGDTEPLETLGSQLEAEGRFVRWLPLDYAFHTHQMDAIEGELINALAFLSPQPTRIDLVSTVTGKRCDGQSLDANYWWQNVRKPVLFEPAISGLIASGQRRFLEIGPHPALRSSLDACLAEHQVQGQVFHSLSRERDESQELTSNAARLHLSRVEVDWQSINQSAGNFIRQPHYPWNYQDYWLDEGELTRRKEPPIHPLLGQRLTSARPTWQFKLDPSLFPYLKDHQIWGGIVFPAAGYIEIGLAISQNLFPGASHSVEELEVKSALFVSETDVPTVQVAFDQGSKAFQVFSSSDDKNWELHACGRLVARTTATDAKPLNSRDIDLQRMRDRLPGRLDHDRLYDELAAMGYGFGPDFSLLQQIWVADLFDANPDHNDPAPDSYQDAGARYAALAEITVPAHLVSDAGAYCFHPAVLDACFQATHGSRDRASQASQHNFFYLPQSIDRVQVFQNNIPTKLLAYAEPKQNDGATIVCDISVYDESGRRVAEILGFQVGRVEHPNNVEGPDNWLYEFQWEPQRLKGTGIKGSCRFPDSSTLVAAVQNQVPEVYQEQNLDTYYEHVFPAIERIMVQSVQNAYIQLGWDYRPGDRFTFDQLIERLGIAEEHHRLVQSQLGWLATTGCLRQADEFWNVEQCLLEDDPASELAALSQDYPQFDAGVALAQATAPHLAGVMSGDTDPLELMFPGGSNTLLGTFYKRAADIPAYHRLIQNAIAMAIEKLPKRRAIRVLELGGGTGSLTRSILDVLPAGRSEYLFTDIGRAFVADAKREFAGTPGMEFQTFDIERPAAEQGISPGSFDLVVAFNVLHATTDLTVALNHVQECMAPDGMFVFWEIVRRRAMLDNVFGLLKGWWRFTDYDQRVDSPLLSQEKWRSLLDRCGFEDVGSFTCTPNPEDSEQAVFVCRGGIAKTDDTVSTPEPITGQCSLVFADDSGVADRLTDSLEGCGERIIRLRRGDEFRQGGDTEFTLTCGSREELKRVFASLEDPAVTRVIHCWSLDGANGNDLEADEFASDGQLTQLLDAQSRGVLSALHLSQALDDGQWSSPPRVYLVTRGAQCPVPGDATSGFPASSLIGFARVANSETPQYDWTLVDLDSPAHPLETEDLFHEITHNSPEHEVAFRDDARLVNRVRRVRVDEMPQRLQEIGRSDGGMVPFRVEMRKAGLLTDLSLNETRRRDPGPDEIEVAVKSLGINFRDVMKALGMYPGEPAELLSFGDDFAGTVARVGSNVIGLQPGDRVAGIAPYSFRSHLTVDHRMTFKTRAEMSFEAAATLPTVFMTSHFVIDQVARMRSGEKLLVHAGAGGIGQSAIQVARHRGVEVLATAGTTEKREFLRSLGIEHVMNSRTLEFTDEVMKFTDGKGVDVVLNSLAGEFIPKSLDVLAPFGRFVEIGKVDVYENSKIGLAAFKNNLSYHMVDLAQVIAERPGLVAEIFQELSIRFEAGDYVPLTHKVFPITEVVSAFRYMAQGHHIGKNVLSLDMTEESPPDQCGPEMTIGPCTEDGQRLRSDSTYLITGGAGGFGLEVAKWMICQGACHVILMSRSGPSEEAMTEIAGLCSERVKVHDIRGDVTRPVDVRRVFDEIASDHPPLKGVVHAAMVLDDEFIALLDEQRFNQALHPKLLGAWNLHKATTKLALDHFVCFSSFSSVIGMPKQANYNAGNSFLDSLAHYRRARGLPALTINWGALSGAGFIQRNQKTADYLSSIGINTLHVDEALDVLGELMLRDTPLIAAGRANWKQMARFSHGIGKHPMYQAVASEGSQGRSGQSLRNQLEAASTDQRSGILEERLVEQVAAVFGIDAFNVDRNASLSTLGLDSLMAVELMNRIESETGANLTMGHVLSGPSVRELSATLLGLIHFDEEASGADVAGSADDTPIDFALESQLDPTIVPAMSDATDSMVHSSSSPRLLLTGATGFLGAYLLQELLETTESKIVCLVRATDETAGLRRVRENLTGYGYGLPLTDDRVSVIVGDFSLPRFGLSEENFDRLAENIDLIYHNGADVNLLLPYESLRQSNVNGTREMLRLACLGKAKPLHFVSTFTVFATEANRGETVCEVDELPPCEELLYGYSQTKWVSEQLIQQARDRGLPVTIYRPGHITGDSETGTTNLNDLLHTIILACLQLGAAPFEEVDLDLTPVNYVARAIVALSSQQESSGGNFHLTNPQPLKTQVLIDYMKRANVDVDLIDYEQWRSRLFAMAEQVGVSMDEFGSLADVLLPRVSGNGDRGLHPRFDSLRTQEALADTDVRCPPVDAELLSTGHSFLQSAGLAILPKPPEELTKVS